MALDVTALRGAIEALDKSFAYLNSDMAKGRDLREQFRAASIHAFECTYELGFKMLRRQLEEISATPAALKGESYMAVIRAGAEAGLIADVERFRHYREIRNITSHTYAPKAAEQVIAVLPDFVGDMRFFWTGSAGRMAAEIDAEAADLDFVKAVLRRLTPDRDVYAFGSRVTGRAAKFSDLDLAIMGDEPLPWNVSADLREAFEESGLPFKVDILDWARAEDCFRRSCGKAGCCFRVVKGMGTNSVTVHLIH